MPLNLGVALRLYQRIEPAQSRYRGFYEIQKVSKGEQRRGNHAPAVPECKEALLCHFMAIRFEHRNVEKGMVSRNEEHVRVIRVL